MQRHSADGQPYRADIDGLRAIAVLAVVFYHANSAWLPGGFVGVDIFFVISGFLISGIIFTRVDRGTFSLLDFYRRRVQRIAPAMFVVIACTLALAWWLLLPRDVINVARSALLSVASLANVYFWQLRGGYFDNDTRELPLLHLWSLGVEEQFYMLWPLVLLAVGRRWKSRAFLISCAIAALTSFVLGDVLFWWDPSFVYFLLPTRAGELLSGAILASLVLTRQLAIPSTIRAALAPAAVAAIGASLALFNDSTVFPGVRALLPTLGTAALLAVGSQPAGSFATRLLSARPLVAIGLISYSVYLWHWPLMAFYRYGYGEPTTAAQWGLPALALALGALSYAVVEQPTRALRLSPLRTIGLGYVAPAAAIAIAAGIVLYGPRLGMPTNDARLPVIAALRDETRPAFAFDYVCQQERLSTADLSDPRCVVGPRSGDEPRMLLWGDSNAAHYIGVIGKAAERAGFAFRNAEISACPPLFSDPAAFVAPVRYRECRDSLMAVQRATRRYPVVLLGASWTDYDRRSNTFLPTVFDTVDRLLEQGAFVVLLGKIPVVPNFDRRCPVKQLTFPFLTCGAGRVRLDGHVQRVNDALRNFAAGHKRLAYFDMTRYLCSDGWCRSNEPDGEPLYYDPGHLSMPASWRLGAEIQDKHGMPPPFAAAAAAARSSAQTRAAVPTQGRGRN
jgi:peptidoglycan/LPS O-acetylase OafA/YrhL